MAKLISLQIGAIKRLGDKDAKDFLRKAWESASFKTPVSSVYVSFKGLQGDSVADKVHHGGTDKAVFANSYENYPRWAEFLGLPELPFGALAENLTVTGLDESNVCLGDIHEIGDVTLQVVQPRKPCWKISRRWQNKAFTKEIYDSGLTGWYYKVLKEGFIQSGDAIKVQSDPQKITILQANEAFKNPKQNQKTMQTILHMECVAKGLKDSLEKALEGSVDLGYMKVE